MATTSIVLTVLAVLVVLGTAAALAWLARTLRWEVIEDEELSDRAAGSGRWLKAWLKPRPPKLTYRRDRLGRFRRYRR